MLFCDDSMNAFANRHNLHDLHGTQVRFGGDIFLEPRSKRFAELIAEDGKGQREWDKQNTPQRGLGPSKREPGKGPGKKRAGRHIRPTAGMNRKVAFAGVEPRMGFRC